MHRAVVILAGAFAAVAASADPAPVERMPGVVVLAPQIEGDDPDRLSYSVRIATSDDAERLRATDVTELLRRALSGVSIDHAQNNPLQPDLSFRGATASPLLGLPQALAVYQDGVRINEPLGDSVDWDLIPLAALRTVQVAGGAQPLFGPNALGGAVALRMKTGFDHRGTTVDASGGSFGRRTLAVQHGARAGALAWYGAFDGFDEDGWRQFSPSIARRWYATLGWRGAHEDRADLSLTAGDTALRGNGASPAELLEIDRTQVFTHPDITRNRNVQWRLSGDRRVGGGARLSAIVHQRSLDTDSFNGDTTAFASCAGAAGDVLVEPDFDDADGDGRCSFDRDDGVVPVLDPGGAPIAAVADGVRRDAVNNIGRRAQRDRGLGLQLAGDAAVLGRRHEWAFGASWNRGDARYESNVEVASLRPDRSTTRTGIFAAGAGTDIASRVALVSVFASDRIALSDRADLALAVRRDETRVRLRDRSGAVPELNGDHRYVRTNPSVGIAWRWRDSATLFANVGTSARTPTPVELACASADAPCNLPNAFLADPPLDAVVARSAELGLRGDSDSGWRWRVALYGSRNRDDILFQATGGAQGNVGYFANVADTTRAGVDAGLAFRGERWRWSLDYTFVDARFDDAFAVSSPSHPASEPAGDDDEVVALDVPGGARIPGIPRHQANFSLDVATGPRIELGADVVYRSGVHLRGDEANLLARTDAYAVLDLRATCRVHERAWLYLKIENALDASYETFGLLGEPDEVFPGFDDPRFYGAGPPRGAWLGLRVEL